MMAASSRQAPPRAIVIRPVPLRDRISILGDRQTEGQVGELVEFALLVLAIGAGSVFLSHVNDAGFWLVKEYFGMTVGQTFKTWSLMETILSVVAMVTISLLALALGVF